MKIKGHAKEASGTPVEAVYQGYLAELKKRHPGLKTIYSPKRNSIDFEWFFSMPPLPKAKPEEKEGN